MENHCRASSYRIASEPQKIKQIGPDCVRVRNPARPSSVSESDYRANGGPAYNQIWPSRSLCPRAAMSQYPLIFRVRQSFQSPTLPVPQIPTTVAAELSRLNLGQKIKKGQSIAITAGSRGVANIALIIKAAVEHFTSLGAQPFIVPAMGSHGGGTAEGQRGLIECYGITESYCGCSIRAIMETVVVCQAADGFPVHF